MLKYIIVSLGLCAGIVACTSSDPQFEVKQTTQAVEGEIPEGVDEPIICEIPPESPYEKEIASEGYFDESITDPIPVGKRINLLDDEGNITDAEQFFNYDLIIQRLTERSYLIQYNVFQSYVYKGDEGLLMMDCGGHNAARPPFIPNDEGELEFHRGGVELQRIKQALNIIGEGLPLDTLVLSHPHTDHVGHSQILKYENPNLRVVASKQLNDHVKQYNLPIAEADRVVYNRWGGFFFEHKFFRLFTPTTAAHSLADSALISPDGVQMSVDITGPGRLSFIFHSVADNPDGVVLFNRMLLGAAGYECDVTDPVSGIECEMAGPTREPMWGHGIFGHFNIGSVEDVIHTLRYYRDQYAIWWPLLFGANPKNLNEFGPPKTIEQFIDLNSQHSVDLTLMRLFDSQADDMYTALAPKYFNQIQWKTAWHDMMEINQSVFLYRSGSNQINPPQPGQIPPGGIPDFSPIAPYTKLEWGNWM